MTPDNSRHDLHSLWLNQPAEEHAMALADIRRRFARFESRVARRNLIEYVGAFLVVVSIVVIAPRESNRIVLAGGVLLAIGALFVAYHLHRWGSVRTTPADLALKDCLAYQRGELVRQRDLLRGVWWWYLLPMVPGPALITIGRAIERPDRRMFAAVYALTFAVLFVVVGTINQRGARRMGRVIDEIDKAAG